MDLERTLKFADREVGIDKLQDIFNDLKRLCAAELDTADKDLREAGLSLPENPTIEEKSLLYACLVSARLYDNYFPLLNKTLFGVELSQEERLQELSPRIRETDPKNIASFLEASGLTMLSAVRGYLKKQREDEQQQQNEQTSLQEIRSRAKKAKPINKFKTPKGILETAKEEDPSFYIWSLCVAYILEKQGREFADKDNPSGTANGGIFPALQKIGYTDSINLPSDYRGRGIILNIDNLIRTRRKDGSYHPTGSDYKLAGEYIRKLQKNILLIPTGRKDENGEDLLAEFPGVIPLITAKTGIIKEAIVFLGEDFRTDLGYNRITLGAIPEERISELEKRVIIYFQQRTHKALKEETIDIQDLFHDIKVKDIHLYKKQGRKRLDSDFWGCLDKIVLRNFPIKKYHNNKDGTITVNY